MSPRKRAFLFLRFSSDLVAWCNSGRLGIATSCGAQQSGVRTGGSAVGAVEGGASKATVSRATLRSGCTVQLGGSLLMREPQGGAVGGVLPADTGGRRNRGGPASCTVQLQIRLTTIASCTVQLERAPAATPRAAVAPVARGCWAAIAGPRNRVGCRLHGATPGVSYHHHELHGATGTNTSHRCRGGEAAGSGWTVQLKRSPEATP